MTKQPWETPAVVNLSSADEAALTDTGQGGDLGKFASVL